MRLSNTGARSPIARLWRVFSIARDLFIYVQSNLRQPPYGVRNPRLIQASHARGKTEETNEQNERPENRFGWNPMIGVIRQLRGRVFMRTMG